MRTFLLIFCALGCLYTIYIVDKRSAPVGGELLSTTISAPPDTEAFYRESFIESSFALYTHAPAITELANGDIVACWYAGSREGHNDVNIYMSRYDRDSNSWGKKEQLMSSAQLADSLNVHIRKLGNPVISQAPDGKLWLFFVSVSIGGWAGSAINSMYSLDNGLSWSEPKRIVSSPFVNVSTLVKQPPVYMQNGNIILPVYHEFIGKFSEVLVLNSDSELLDKSRITWGMNSLQPSLAVIDQITLLAFSRNAVHGDSVYSNTGSSLTFNWQDNPDTGLPNPNSAVALTNYSNDQLLLVNNDLPTTRNRLSLHLAGKDQIFKRFHEFEYTPYTKITSHSMLAPFETTKSNIKKELLSLNVSTSDNMMDMILKKLCRQPGACEAHYAYPYLIQASNGNFHLVYTWQKSIIKHIAFNKAWLDTLEAMDE